MTIELLNKIEDYFALLYEQALNENVSQNPMMLLGAFKLFLSNNSFSVKFHYPDPTYPDLS
jgi:hypothetical protein